MQVQDQQRTAEWYDRMANEYSAALTFEDLMEATTQATQRKITLTALDIVASRRTDLYVFNELLVQYLKPGADKLVQVVPDNMVVLHDGPLEVERSFAVERQPAGPFWMLEYVSPENARKDYHDNHLRYIHDLRVPYYLMFDPLAADGPALFLYRGINGESEPIPANAAGRLPLPEIDVEVALLDGWLRFWHRGELLPLTAELVAQLEHADTERQRAEAERDAERTKRERAERRVRSARQERDTARQERDTVRSERDRERQARLDLEAELARLRGLLPPV